MIAQLDIGSVLHRTYSTGVVTQAAYDALLARLNEFNYLVGSLDAVGNVGQYTSLAIGTDSNPVISYTGSDGLRGYICADTGCTSGITHTLDSGISGEPTIAIGTDNT